MCTTPRGSPGRAGREDHERRVVGARCPPASPAARPRAGRRRRRRCTRGGLLDAAQRALAAPPCRARRPARAPAARCCDPQRDVLGAQLLRAGQRDGAQAPRAEQREDPFRPRAHQRHHDVAAPDAGRARPAAVVARPRRATSRERVASAPTRPAPIARSASSRGRSRASRSTTSRVKLKLSRCTGADATGTSRSGFRLPRAGAQLRSNRREYWRMRRNRAGCCAAIVLRPLCCAGLPGQAFGGRLVATGHDADSHCSGVRRRRPMPLRAGGGHLRARRRARPVPADAAARLLVGRQRRRRRSRTPARAGGPNQVVCPTANLAAFNALRAHDRDATARSSSGRRSTRSALPTPPRINARKADIATFFNQGGGILALRRRLQRRRPGRPLLPVRPDRDRRQAGHLSVPA